MDVVAHWLWTYAIYFKTKYRLLAALFGVLPDIIAFGPFFLYKLLFGSLGKPALGSIPEYVFIGYNFTHSLVVFLIVFAVIYFITREIPWVIGGWLLHILIDIPTHTSAFFPTPFLWPISNFTVSVVSWSNLIFMIVNYSLLVIVYTYLFLFLKKKKQRKTYIPPLRVGKL